MRGMSATIDEPRQVNPERLAKLESDVEYIKRDIGEIKGAVTKLVDTLSAEFTAVRGEMATQFTAVRGEMATEFKAVRAESAAEFKAVRAEVREDIQGVRVEMRWIIGITLTNLVGMVGGLLSLVAKAYHWFG